MGHILVRSVDVIDGDNGQVAVITEVAEGDAFTRLDVELVDLLLGNVEGDGDGEKDTAGEADVLYNSTDKVLAKIDFYAGHDARTRCNRPRSRNPPKARKHH